LAVVLFLRCLSLPTANGNGSFIDRGLGSAAAEQAKAIGRLSFGHEEEKIKIL
jgi:hypothetical protein